VITGAVNWLAAAANGAAAADEASGSMAAAGELAAVWLMLQHFYEFMLLCGAAYNGSSSSRASLLPQQPGGGGQGPLAAARGLLLSQLLGLAGSNELAAELVLPLVLKQLAVWRSDSGSDRCAGNPGGGDGVAVKVDCAQHTRLTGSIFSMGVCETGHAPTTNATHQARGRHGREWGGVRGRFYC
jgi:hypothetical protein